MDSQGGEGRHRLPRKQAASSENDWPGIRSSLAWAPFVVTVARARREGGEREGSIVRHWVQEAFACFGVGAVSEKCRVTSLFGHRKPVGFVSPQPAEQGVRCTPYELVQLVVNLGVAEASNLAENLLVEVEKLNPDVRLTVPDWLSTCLNDPAEKRRMAMRFHEVIREVIARGYTSKVHDALGVDVTPCDGPTIRTQKRARRIS